MQLNLKNTKSETNYRMPNDSIVEFPISPGLVPITIGGVIIPTDLIQFDLPNFDII